MLIFSIWGLCSKLSQTPVPQTPFWFSAAEFLTSALVIIIIVILTAVEGVVRLISRRTATDIMVTERVDGSTGAVSQTRRAHHTRQYCMHTAVSLAFARWRHKPNYTSQPS